MGRATRVLLAAAVATWLGARELRAEESAAGEAAKEPWDERELAAGVTVDPLFEASQYVLSQSHPFFGNTSRTWAETSARFGALLGRQTDFAKVTFGGAGLALGTWGEDPYGTGHRRVGTSEMHEETYQGPEVDLELAYVKLSEIGGWPVTLTVGRQDIMIGTGFLIGDGVYDGYAPGKWQTVYSTPRKAFDAARLQATVLGVDVDAFGFVVDETWDAGGGDDGRVFGIDLTRAFEQLAGKYSLGVYHHLSDTNLDNDMMLFDVRGEQRIPGFDGPYVSGEWVKEAFGKCRSAFYCNHPGDDIDEESWHAEIGTAFAELPLRPFFEVGYVYYSKDFTPFAYGFSDWGKWYLGNQLPLILAGTNTKVVRTDVGVWPLETLRLRFLYFNSREADPSGQSDGGTLSDELLWVGEWYPNHWFWVNGVVAYSMPGDAVVESGTPNFFSFILTDTAQISTENSLDFGLLMGVKF